MDFHVSVGDLISSPSTQYEVQELLGSGAFGDVTQCRKVATNETVALKILKSKKGIEEAKQEAAVLQMMKELGSDKFNIVTWNDSFTYQGRFHLEFEKLDMSLFDFLEWRESLELMEIRPIVQQLAAALEFLQSTGIVHADLKPENIMMVDHVRQPLRVKVIDFGSACNNPEMWTGATLQTLWYRSPEVLLGAPFNEAIDVWSLGCIAVELLLGTALFPGRDDYDMMKHIIRTLGKPPDSMLNAGMYTREYFCQVDQPSHPSLWRFKSAVEMRRFGCSLRPITSLSDLMRTHHQLSGEDACADERDRACFVHLLTKLLAVDAVERITPSQILQHPFLTMTHLVAVFSDSYYVESCMEQMSRCQAVSSQVGQEETHDSAASPAHYPDQGHPAGLNINEQPLLQSAIISATHSPPKKREREGVESECGDRSPDTLLAKKRRTERQDAAETGGQISPQKSPLHKRKRDEAGPSMASDGSCSTRKKRRVNLEKQLRDSVQKLLSNSEEARSTSTQISHIKKRKRADEASQGEKASPDKRRK